MAGEGPEYEAAWALGPDTGIGDLDAVLKANWLCNDLGMDPISMGATLAAAMELYERQVITDRLRGIAAGFGSAEALVRMTEATAYREGFGHELAEGSKRMGEKFGHPEVFMGSKGQEFPAYDPRGFQGMGVAYATCNRGGCHLRAWTPGLETAAMWIPIRPQVKGPGSPTNRTEPRPMTTRAPACFSAAPAGRSSSLVACTAAPPEYRYTLRTSCGLANGRGTWNDCGT